MESFIRLITARAASVILTLLASATQKLTGYA
jgi:hypothetical protein